MGLARSSIETTGSLQAIRGDESKDGDGDSKADACRERDRRDGL